MKRVFWLLTVTLAAAAVVGCIKEKDTLEGVPMFTITATGEDVENPGGAQDPAKAGFTIDGTTLRLAWHAGDDIRVFNHANPAQNALYTIKAGFTDKTAQFEGPEVGGTTFDVVAPGTITSPDDAAAGVPNLVQNGNNNTDHLTFNAKLENVAKEDLGNIVFNSNWASDHGATLKKGAIVKFILTLPNAITEPVAVSMIQFNGDANGTTGILEHPISANLTGVSTTSEHVITVYAQAGWDDMAFAAGKYLKVGVWDANGDYYTWSHRITKKATLMAGKVNRIQTGSSTVGTSGADKWIEQLFAGGSGAQGDPYLIASAKHLDNMHVDGVLKKEERVYFKLIKDIDMESYLQSHTWVPLNSSSPYDYLIDFDGDGHTIDHFSCSFDATGKEDPSHHPTNKPSFFGLLYGTCKNVNFTNATITTNYGTAGIIGGYVGYSGKKAVVQNVHVSGTVTKVRTYTNPTSGNYDLGDTGVGGLGGRIVFSYIDSCSADVVVDVSNYQNYVGGLFGIDYGDPSRVRNCWSSGSVTGSQRVGGICGGLIRTETEIINCFSTASITCTYAMGGIVGHCNLDKASSVSPTTTYPDNVIKGCIAWQNSMVVRNPSEGGSSHYSSGAIAGYTSANNYLTNCLRNPNMAFQDYSSSYVLYDQEDASPTTALVTTGSGQYNFPYHGKAAGSTRLSTVAQSLGWDSNVWDFSGDIPVLTGVIEPEPAGETPESGEPAVQALSLSQGSLARSFPGCYNVRSAQPAAQDGITWEHTDVTSDGAVKYFHATGTVSAGWMDSGAHRQALYVVDYDLSNTNYEVKIVSCSPACVASQVHKAVGAIATINGGYEIASIAVKANMSYTWAKIDTSTNADPEDMDNIKPGSEVVTKYPYGSPKSYMPNNTIGDTGVENWKSEGTFYCDGQQGVRIAFDGYGGGATNKYGANTYNRTVKQERLWYRLGTDNETGFISSSPIIHANYIRFGYSYRDRCSNFGGSKSNSEYPKVHQTGAYPRTAVAIAYPEYDDKPHLLLIVVDGRYADNAEGGGYGYSAYWLERHLANAFGPKYTLNLDGGGSSTMVVDGCGASGTDVVNYPSDNNGASGSNGDGTVVNHEGQRARDTFICIVPKI